MHRIGPDGSILMLGRDLRPMAEVQQQLVTAQLALERDYEAQRELDTRYRVLMEMTRDPVMLVSMSSGRITDLNPAAAAACWAAPGPSWSAPQSRRNSTAAAGVSFWKRWPMSPPPNPLPRWR